VAAASLTTLTPTLQPQESRDALASELASLQAQVAGVNAELSVYKENDPEAFKAMCEATTVAKLAANRWCDNLDELLCWCKRQFAGRETDLTELFKENGALDLEYLVSWDCVHHRGSRVTWSEYLEFLE
jgi:hypothetical protein